MIEVMVPFWGEPALLLEAVRSVIAQTYQDWRLTVVDDCYPEAVADSLAALGDDRVHYVRNNTNLGITDNYRKALSLSSGEFVQLFGCDDIMLPDFLQDVADGIRLFPSADIIQPGAQTIDETGRVVHALRDLAKRLLIPKGERPTMLSGEPLATSLMRGDWLYWPALVFRRSTIASHDFRDGFPIIQDLGIITDMVMAGANLLYLPKVSFQYRRHRASASSASLIDGSRFADDRRFFDLYARLLRARGWKHASAAARRRATSRLDGLAALPSILAAGNAKGVKSALTHIFQP